MPYVYPMTLKEAIAAADVPALANLLGHEFEMEPGKIHRLVKLASAAFGSGSGADSAAKKAFKWSDQEARTVVPVSGATDRVCGVSPPELPNLAVGDLFLLQCSGRATLIVAGDQNVTAGNYATPDDDADKGKITDTATFAEGITFGICVETQGTGDGEVLVDLIGKLT